MPSNTIVSVQTASAQFSELLNRARDGDEIIITVDGKPAAKLVPVHAKGKPLPYGLLKGKLTMKADFDEPLPKRIEGKEKAAHSLPPPFERSMPRRQRGRVKGIDDSSFFEPLECVESAAAEKRSNPHSGTSFDDFLRDEGTFDETHPKPSECARNEQIEDSSQGD